MIIVMTRYAQDEQIQAVVDKIRAAGLSEHVSRGTERTIIGAVGDERVFSPDAFALLPGVERAMRVVREYRIVSREVHPADSVVQVRGLSIGGPAIHVIAGPAAVETPEQMALSAQMVRQHGGKLLRGGAFKPRTSPYAFQGVGVEGLEILQQEARRQGLPMVSELLDVRLLDTFLEYDVDVIEIGARNMQNVGLLKEVGRINKPVILKRGPSSSLSEWLMAAEYIAAGGNHNIIFCERGVRSFETSYRNMLDLSAIAVMKRETHLPVIVDPSHAAGKAWMVPALAKAALAAGADGLMLDIHPDPANAWCDGEQALNPGEFALLMQQLSALATTLGRSLA
ncbi:2-keto-3-deoxy-D-arabino-heptulosonate-7-phosphate synthase I beta [Aquitalea magnusonii]|uniref:2-keto-3-deoxy-D-arabino-heptulosonate-7-phosphate synthase I beta n=1 Tax=Aquitalea magnusonii TaxID=332411 RepID=A0A3G9GFL0_9NEIS|nr:3-deoxy-7-phosphoheptulonate synthase [Aquitalea magnusonii]BBF85429.1 2-keto-3-deoxy-D-arabino-heptulosonate-7-phosphate synthase I beta [Aquitalea magnusonii]